MPSRRPNLTLDEKSFQGLLAAAFTVQEHNDHRKQARRQKGDAAASREPASICQHCGAPKATEGARCPSCGLDEFRPGERMQHNWASMWLMSQEQGLWPERSPGNGEAAKEDLGSRTAWGAAEDEGEGESGSYDAPASLPMAGAATEEPDAPGDSGNRRDRNHIEARSKLDLRGRFQRERSQDKRAQVKAQADIEWPLETNNDLEDVEEEDAEVAVEPYRLAGGEASSNKMLTTTGARSGIFELFANGGLVAAMQRLADWRVRLRFHRADVYLGTAIFVAAVALLWPAAGAPGKPAPLGPFERALVALGIAETPATAVHLQGDPSIVVWIDPHTALYYCPGEERYGKTVGGQLTSQRDAQMDRFEPAGRSACE